jgi:hypothetical protein
LLCTLIASKGVVSGTGSSMTVGKDCEIKGVCIHASKVFVLVNLKSAQVSRRQLERLRSDTVVR